MPKKLNEYGGPVDPLENPGRADLGIKAVETEYVMWDIIGEAVSLLREDLEKRCKTEGSISVEQQVANFLWAERQVLIRKYASMRTSPQPNLDRVS